VLIFFSQTLFCAQFLSGGDGEGIGDILDMMDILIQEKEDPEELSKKTFRK
jgi:hypothetical protein